MYLRHQTYTLYYRDVCILVFLHVFAYSMLLRCMLKFKRLACGSDDVTQYNIIQYNKLNNFSIDNFNIPQKHRGLHKLASWATCGPRVWDPGLSYQMIIIINQAQQVMHCYIIMVLTYWPIMTLLHSFPHEDMLVVRTLSLVEGLLWFSNFHEPWPRSKDS